MTRKELIECLTLLKEQARNCEANTFVWDISIDSFNFVIDMAIKALDRQYAIENMNEELEVVQKGIKNDDVLIGFNLAVAICNKHIGKKAE